MFLLLIFQTLLNEELKAPGSCLLAHSGRNIHDISDGHINKYCLLKIPKKNATLNEDGSICTGRLFTEQKTKNYLKIGGNKKDIANSIFFFCKFVICRAVYLLDTDHTLTEKLNIPSFYTSIK